MILLIGLVFSVVFTLFMSVMLGGSRYAGYLIDPACLLSVLLPVILFLCVTGNGRIICRYIKNSFRKKPQYSEADYRGIALSAKNSVKITLAAGGFVFLTGIMAMFLFLDFSDPNAANMFGRNLSAGLISLLYSVAIAFFAFSPLQAWAEGKIKAADAPDGC